MADSSDPNPTEDNKRCTSSERALTGTRRESRTRRPKSADLRGRGSSSSMNNYVHDKRVVELRTREDTLQAKCAELAVFMQNHQPTLVSTESAMAVLYHYKLVPTEEYFTYSIVSQSNLAGFSQLNKAAYASSKESLHLFGRVIKINKLVGDVAFRLNKSLAISKYFGDKSRAYVKINDIFCVNYKKIFVFQEKFKLENSLVHKTIAGEIDVSLVKQWISQLASAVEQLNLHGVAHRFVRVENVLLQSKSTIKLTSFDMACLFWDPDQRCMVSSKKILPIENLVPNLMNHLPPEAFVDNYDCSMVDVWSIGVILCSLLAGENPFTVTPADLEHDKTASYVKLEHWKTFEMKRLIPCEIRSLLNDIFVDADARITTFDLIKDKRLTSEMNSETFIRKKQPAYYRIDLAKKINLDMPINRSSTIDAQRARIIQANSFASESTEVFNYDSFKIVANEEAITKYKILRDASFTNDLSPKMIINDYYLKAVKQQDGAIAEQQNEFLVKIVLASTVPLRHYHQILGESSKIIRYFSAVDPFNRFLHRVHDIYRDDSRIYIFFDMLTGHRSLHSIVHAEIPLDQLPPLSTTTDGTQKLTQENIIKWTQQLARTVAHLARHSVSHRYVRPEFVFIDTNGDTKLSHFDLACFAWHPENHVVVPRSCGLQDELEQQWNHLPPECFEPSYESLLLDVWSVAVIFVFSLTSEWPFTVPHSDDSATSQWTEWKQTKKGSLMVQSLELEVALLNQVFVSFNRRISAESLASELGTKETDAMTLAEPKPKSPTGTTNNDGTALKLEPKERKSNDAQTGKARKASTDKTRGSSRSSTNIGKAKRESKCRRDLKEGKEKKSKKKFT